MTMVVIGYDRYNVIVKGFKGTKINGIKACGVLFLVWVYGVLGCCPPFWGWGGYALGKLDFRLSKKNDSFKIHFQRAYT